MLMIENAYKLFARASEMKSFVVCSNLRLRNQRKQAKDLQLLDCANRTRSRCFPWRNL